MGCSVRVGISTGIIYLLTPACVGTPAGIDQMQGLVTPSVTELVAPLIAVWRHLHLMEIHLHRAVVEFTCSEWSLVWTALVVRRLRRLLKLAVKNR